MDRASLIFCAAALALSFAVSAAGFSLAALPPEVVRAARTPTPAEKLPPVDLGGGFGQVSVIDLVGYYIDNPPAPAATSAGPAAVRHFGGC